MVQFAETIYFFSNSVVFVCNVLESLENGVLRFDMKSSVMCSERQSRGLWSVTTVTVGPLTQ